MKETRIIGLLIKDRIKESGRTQHTLTKYAHLIRSRLGFHEVTENVCSRVGIIILQLCGEPDQWEKFIYELRQIGGIEVQEMQFKY